MSTGTTVQIIGAVVDVKFPSTAIPKIYDALTIEAADLTLEVQQQLGDGVVRTIAMGSSEGLKRGMEVEIQDNQYPYRSEKKLLGELWMCLANQLIIKVK